MRDALEKALCDQIGAQRYATWFDGCVEVSRNQQGVTIGASSSFERDLICKRFATEVRQAVNQICGAGASVVYTVSEIAEGSTPPDTGTDPTKKQPTNRVGRSKASAEPKPARIERSDPLSGWIEGQTNQEATLLTRRLIRGEETPSPALFWGPAGVGKTSLLGAIAAGIKQHRRRRRVLALTAEQFLVSFVDAIRGGGLPSFRQKHRGVDLLLVDNVHQLLGKKRTAEEFLQTVEFLQNEGAGVVLSSDRGPYQLREFGPELSSRICGGVSVEILPADQATRRGMLAAAVGNRGIEPGPGVLDLLARRLVGGAREVQGALNRMTLLAETFDLPLDTALAERVADDLNRLSTPPVRMDDIQRAVCGVFGVEARDLKSSKRTKAVTEPRMLAMWLARKMTGSAWSEIGDYFGRRSHSTVISAHRRVERLLAGPQPARLSTPAASDLGDAIRRVEDALRTA